MHQQKIRYRGNTVTRPLDIHHFHWPSCHVRLDCQQSNPHSCLACPGRAGASRGFLPRGLSDACPLSRLESSHICDSGQASDNP